MRIMLVDDSRATRLIVRTTIESMGLDPLEILEASDGEEALELLQNEKLEIDLVLIDWDMPRMDGVTFLKRLRVVQPFREIPVIMVTSQSSKEKVTEALRWGARDYVIKPFNSAVLLQKIQAVKGKMDALKLEDTAVMLRDMVQAAQVEREQPFLRQLPDGITQFILKVGVKKAWAQGTQVLKAGEGVDILHILVSGTIDRTAGGRLLGSVSEGDCLEARAFMSGVPAEATAVARTASQGLLLDRLALGDCLRRHPRLGHYLRGLLSAPSPSEEDGVKLRGTLKDFPMVDVVQVLSMTQKTGVLNLMRKGQAAGIALDRGEVRHAWVDDLEGDDAFYRLLGWEDAAFTFDSGKALLQTTIRTPTMSLLIEGARRADETKVILRPEGPS